MAHETQTQQPEGYIHPLERVRNLGGAFVDLDAIHPGLTVDVSSEHQEEVENATNAVLDDWISQSDTNAIDVQRTEDGPNVFTRVSTSLGVVEILSRRVGKDPADLKRVVFRSF